jgi:F-type H+-transporting ATPase subunit alpha
VFAATNGFVDRIRTERVPEFLDQLTDRFHSEHEDLLAKVAEGDWSDETQEAVRNGVAELADDFGYDLDEEGQPLEERDETTREEEGIRARRDGDGEEREQGADEEAEETEETEEAGAVRA